MKPVDTPVDFIICGTQKGGTTALDYYLRTHPSVAMAIKKEIHFFDNESNFSGSMVDYSQYHSHFKPTAAGCLRGEATPIYMYWKNAPGRIFEYNKNMKLIISLRNPIDRAYSHWNMARSRNVEPLSFFDAIKNEAARRHSANPLQSRIHSYVDRGFYTEQLSRIWELFPRNQVLVIKNEDLKNAPQKTLRALCDFLGIPDFPQVEKVDVHSRDYISRISPHDFNYLKLIFFDEIKKLEQLLEWDCREWLRYDR